jgi:hypothetical protein
MAELFENKSLMSRLCETSFDSFGMIFILLLGTDEYRKELLGHIGWICWANKGQELKENLTI